MELYAEILAHFLSTCKAQIIFPDLCLNTKEIMEQECYRTLCRIIAIVKDGALDDAACFQKIEEIVCALEDIGIDGGSRHDFG